MIVLVAIGVMWAAIFGLKTAALAVGILVAIEVIYRLSRHPR